MSKGLWNVFVDPALLESAILNLAINAHDAMPCGGTVKVFARNYVVEETEHTQDPDLLPRQYVQITFNDNGEGIPQVSVRVSKPREMNIQRSATVASQLLNVKDSEKTQLMTTRATALSSA